MLSYKSEDLSVQERQRFLTSGIGPRPIALVSTLSKDGKPNLAPFSFFNAFGANPPTVAFSPARRGRDGTLKDTYYNVADTKECAISLVSYDMVEQISLASSEFDSDVNEFEKSGLTPLKSQMIKPSGVAESPFWFECIVKDIIHTGELKGSGNIVICEIVMFHVNENVLTDHKIDPHKADIVGRFGFNDYVRASGNAIFEVAKPTSNGMGFDQLPDFIFESSVLTANNLARLANQESLPKIEDVKSYYESIQSMNSTDFDIERSIRLKDIETLKSQIKFNSMHRKYLTYCEFLAKLQIEFGDVESAWKTLFFRKLK